ncbi:hypothetical protein [Streptomyces sp. NPDC005423]|uniref:hypothetical protein n=1 Tax=Streptomyces sp. NPDC005423 TaxID=3155343 RepID=UPI0033A58584
MDHRITAAPAAVSAPPLAPRALRGWCPRPAAALTAGLLGRLELLARTHRAE